MIMPEHGRRTPCPSPGLRSTETANKTSTTNFEFHPIFPVSVHFPPCFAKIIIYFPPTLKNSSPVFEKFTCFLYNLCVFRFPYFDHDAFMHHPMHVLEAPGPHNRLFSCLALYFKTSTIHKKLYCINSCQSFHIFSH